MNVSPFSPGSLRCWPHYLERGRPRAAGINVNTHRGIPFREISTKEHQRRNYATARRERERYSHRLTRNPVTHFASAAITSFRYAGAMCLRFSFSLVESLRIILDNLSLSRRLSNRSWCINQIQRGLCWKNTSILVFYTYKYTCK